MTSEDLRRLLIAVRKRNPSAYKIISGASGITEKRIKDFVNKKVSLDQWEETMLATLAGSRDLQHRNNY